MSRAGIYVSKPGESVVDNDLKPYEQQMMSSRGALIENIDLEQTDGKTGTSGSAVAHGSTTGIPFVLISGFTASYAHALVPAQISATQFLLLSSLSGMSGYFYRQFYNEEHPS